MATIEGPKNQLEPADLPQVGKDEDSGFQYLRYSDGIYLVRDPETGFVDQGETLEGAIAHLQGGIGLHKEHLQDRQERAEE